ncbi:HAD family hydrolase [Gemmatimonas groenlandica]|uniref:HAD family hydrolase n=1 Tax=Gemmatimonas groenlandica TaxID=2732249 RepID=A0A6M4IQY1_9BACT|nr:HAD family hydrolase [Gemmatimonas groenlandica]QJR36179.1 HAD family hydrolase [Gemmatimonas groenlandica]
MTVAGVGRVTIVAFDGIIADTLPLRARALADAMVLECAATGVAIDADALRTTLLPLVPGRTFSESMASALASVPALQHDRIQHDVTLHDIIALRAQHAWAATVAHGVPLHDGVLARLQALVARGVRVVLRSDSQRREVEPLLRLAGLEDSMLFLRCADDVPRLTGAPSLQASYEAIAVRLERLRVPRGLCDAVEASGGTAALALGFSAASRTVL